MFGPRGRWLLLAGFALLIACRLPQAWRHGRFQDEEATVFLAYAWHRPWRDALFRPFAGYWNLAADATTLAVARLVTAGVVTLERAPYLTMGAALVVQVLPAVLILTGRARWIAGRLPVVASLLVIATAPATEEVFLNVLHSQLHLALCAALVLALDVPRRPCAQAGSAALLFAAPLCGPGAIVMLPLFAGRAARDRDAGRAVQGAAFAAGAALQLLVFYGASPMRGHLIDPGTVLAAMLVRLVALPILGFDVARGIGAAAYLSQMAGRHGWWGAAAAAAVLFGLLLWQAARRRDDAFWLVLAALAMAVATFGFGMIGSDRYAPFDIAAERYDFLPAVLLGLGLVALAMRPGGAGRPVYAALCALMLLRGAIGYRHPLTDLARGPSWPAEVAAWRHDHRHGLAVWPRPWAADLSDATQPCTPLGASGGSATDPRYCESGWFHDLVRAPRERPKP